MYYLRQVHFLKALSTLDRQKNEKIVAKRAFEKCYQRQCHAVLTKLKENIATADKLVDIWLIHDVLAEERKKIDSKYDYWYSVLIFVFARLLKEGWLQESDLYGMEDDKI